FVTIVRLTFSRLPHRELLNPLIARIRHVEKTLAVHRHAVRPGKLAGTFPGAADAQDVLAFRRELLHAVVQAADPDAVVAVEHDADGTEGELAEAEFQAAEAAGLVALVAPGQERFAFGRQLLHPAGNAFGGVQPALAVLGQEMRAAEARAGMLGS